MKIAECENYLALAYWRTGEINEAESWVEEALSHELPETSDARLYSHVILNLLLLSRKRYEEICSNFAALEQTFLSSADSFLTGNFYMNFGIATKNLRRIDSSLDSLQSARNFFAASGNTIQVAIVENNLSQLYRSEKRFTEAHDAIDRSTKLFRDIGDRTREGYSLDTKALIYFDAGDYRSALEAVDRGIAILGKSENFAYLTDTIATKAKIQLYLNDFSTATLTLVEAVDLAKVRISEQAALNLIGEFEQALKERQSTRARKPEEEKTGIASGDLRLVLPSAIAHFEEYHGVWINNSDLENYGLRRGSLAVVVPCKVKRGDLVAIMETESDLVSCGFYDADFGIVCLEAGDSEPLLFSESDVTILGKIVGVGDGTPAADGTVNIEALKL
jgi:tetratricopeptide (TPR) repeat protein